MNIDSLQLVDVCVRARVHVRVVLAHTEFDNIVDQASNGITCCSATQTQTEAINIFILFYLLINNLMAYFIYSNVCDHNPCS